MPSFLSDRLFKIGAAMAILGSAPLYTIIFLAKHGMWPDPDPNPVGPGLLCFVTLWPGIALMVIGVVRSVRRGSKRSENPGPQ
jgi:hypothetical protein